MNAAHKRIAARDLDYSADGTEEGKLCGLNYPVDGPAKKARTKTRIKVRAHFDRAGGMVDGEMVFDKENNTVTVREKGMKRTYSMRISEVVDFISRRGIGVG